MAKAKKKKTKRASARGKTSAARKPKKKAARKAPARKRPVARKKPAKKAAKKVAKKESAKKKAAKDRSEASRQAEGCQGRSEASRQEVARPRRREGPGGCPGRSPASQEGAVEESTLLAASLANTAQRSGRRAARPRRAAASERAAQSGGGSLPAPRLHCRGSRRGCPRRRGHHWEGSGARPGETEGGPQSPGRASAAAFSRPARSRPICRPARRRPARSPGWSSARASDAVRSGRFCVVWTSVTWKRRGWTPMARRACRA